MSRSIPSVKAWRVTFEDGDRVIVYAPTKYLARLNVRWGNYDFRPIKSIGLPRNQYRN
jgi:hypothetical protein